MTRIFWSETGAPRIGASTTIDRIAADARIAEAYPGILETVAVRVSMRP